MRAKRLIHLIDGVRLRGVDADDTAASRIVCDLAIDRYSFAKVIYSILS